MKKKIFLIVFIILSIVLIGLGVWFLVNPKDSKLLLTQDVTTSNLELVLNEQGIPKYIVSSFSDVVVTDEASALKALEDIKKLMNITSEKISDVLYLKESYVLGDVTYYEMQQKYSGIDVLGAELTISVDKNGKVLALNSSFIPGVAVRTYGLMSETEIKEALGLIYGTETVYYSFEKKIYVDADNNCYIVYLTSLFGKEKLLEVIVNAKTGEIINESELTYSFISEYTGVGLEDKTYTVNLNKGFETTGEEYYEFYDSERNIVISNGIGVLHSENTFTADLLANFVMVPFPLKANLRDNVLTYGNVNDEKSEMLIKNSLTALGTYSEIYDYYYKVLGRKSYDNKGSVIDVTVLVGNSDLTLKYYNAGWVRHFNKMLIGFYPENDSSFVLAKDVLAHEFTHGVVDSIANLMDTKDPMLPNETGALNEAYSDILGALIENENWTMGEKISVVRDLTNPKSLEHPAKKGDEYYFPDTYLTDGRDLEQFLKDNNIEDLRCDACDNGGVHNNSTVISHSAYLMYNNGAFATKEEMAKVWYNSLFLLSSYSNFEDCAYAVIQSAFNLGLSQDKIKIIKDAFLETEVLVETLHDLSGIVTDSESEEVLGGVSVYAVNKLNPYVNYEVYTDDNGNYSLKSLPTGKYEIKFDKAKYKLLEKELDLKTDNNSYNVELEKVEEENYDESQVVFVMDISYSMDTSDPTDVRKHIIANVLSSMDNKSNAALVTFAKNALVVSDGFTDEEVTKKVIMTDVFNISNDNGGTENSGTNGKAGLKKAISLFDSDSETRKYIIFLTDGQDNVNDITSYEDLIEKANKKGIRILTIGLGNDLDSDNLQKLALETSGKYYYADSSTDLYRFEYRLFAELE